MKILITGSRTWKDRGKISGAFDEIAADFPGEKTWIVIEGEAPGADRLSKLEAWGRGWHVAEMRALWHFYPGKAGHIRNAAMTSLAGPEDSVCLALIGNCVKEGCPDPQPHDSHGTTDCMKKVRAAGIPVREKR